VRAESLAVSLEATFVSFPETNMALHRHSLQQPNMQNLEGDSW
jgi:hypothetical protein